MRELLGTGRDLERSDGGPRQSALVRERLPHSVGGLGGTRKDPPPDRVQIERPMDDAGVPARRVHGDLRFLLEHRDSAVVAVREPVRERGPKDPATDDRDVPGLHGPISRKCPEFIMPAHARRESSRLPPAMMMAPRPPLPVLSCDAFDTYHNLLFETGACEPGMPGATRRLRHRRTSLPLHRHSR